MSISASISNTGKLMAKLGALDNVIYVAAADAVQEGMLLVHSDAVRSITDHQSSGRVYKRGGVEHTASEAGSPPNSDTGNLVQHIGFEFDSDSLTATVGTNLEYGKFLEFGTSRMAERPWLYPAFERNKSDIKESVVFAIQQVLKDTSDVG